MLPVLVVGEGTGALVTVRTLGRLGIPLYCLHKRPRGASLSSRYWRRRFLVGDADRTVASHVAMVLQVVKAIGPPVMLIPTGDREAAAVAEAGIADDRVITPRQTPGLIRSLLDKPQMLALAVGHGLSVPRTAQPASAEETRRCADDLTFPVVVKMADPVRDWKQNFVFRDGDELAVWVRTVPEDLFSRMVVQEWIPGGDGDSWIFNGYFDEDSRCIAWFTGRKLRQVPPMAGVSALAVCSRNDELHRQSVSLLQHVGYCGPVDIDYRYDSRDGVYKILDVNPRIGSAFRLGATADGLDVVRVFYGHMTGQTVPPYHPVEGRKWMIEDDLTVAVRHWRSGRLSFHDWWTSVRGVRETAYLAFDDPLPMLIWTASRLRKAARLVFRPRRPGPPALGGRAT